MFPLSLYYSEHTRVPMLCLCSFIHEACSLVLLLGMGLVWFACGFPQSGIVNQLVFNLFIYN